MTAQQQWLEAWLREHYALVFYGTPNITLWCESACVVAPTVEEAVRVMMERMGMVEGLLGEAHQPLLLVRPEENHNGRD